MIYSRFRQKYISSTAVWYHWIDTVVYYLWNVNLHQMYHLFSSHACTVYNNVTDVHTCSTVVNYCLNICYTVLLYDTCTLLWFPTYYNIKDIYHSKFELYTVQYNTCTNMKWIRERQHNNHRGGLIFTMNILQIILHQLLCDPRNIYLQDYSSFSVLIMFIFISNFFVPEGRDRLLFHEWNPDGESFLHTN